MVEFLASGPRVRNGTSYPEAYAVAGCTRVLAASSGIDLGTVQSVQGTRPQPSL